MGPTPQNTNTTMAEAMVSIEVIDGDQVKLGFADLSSAAGTWITVSLATAVEIAHGILRAAGEEA